MKEAALSISKIIIHSSLFALTFSLSMSFQATAPVVGDDITWQLDHVGYCSDTVIDLFLGSFSHILPIPKDSKDNSCFWER